LFSKMNFPFSEETILNVTGFFSFWFAVATVNNNESAFCSKAIVSAKTVSFPTCVKLKAVNVLGFSRDQLSCENSSPFSLIHVPKSHCNWSIFSEFSVNTAFSDSELFLQEFKNNGIHISRRYFFIFVGFLFGEFI